MLISLCAVEIDSCGRHHVLQSYAAVNNHLLWLKEICIADARDLLTHR